MDLHTPELCVTGALRFGPFVPIKYDIMGPFQFVPFMQCRHSVYSMHHRVDGEIQINGVPYVFQNAVGYLEGDRGHSFPKEYAWTQCSFSDGALMLLSNMSIEERCCTPPSFTAAEYRQRTKWPKK